MSLRDYLASVSIVAEPHSSFQTDLGGSYFHSLSTQTLNVERTKEEDQKSIS